MSEASPDQLVDEIEDIRIRLAGTIDELIDRSNPKNVARRQLDKVKARFVTPDGWCASRTWCRSWRSPWRSSAASSWSVDC